MSFAVPQYLVSNFHGPWLVDVVAAAAFDAPDHFGWVACDNRTTRAIAKVFREDYLIPRKFTKAQAYWSA